MSMIHDPDYCSALRTRVDALTPESKPLWGTMRVDQMVWHLNGALSLGLGKLRAQPQKPPIPRALLVPMAMYLPMPKNAPTSPELLPTGDYDLATERAHFHQLIEEFSLKPLYFNWLEHPFFGRLKGPQWSHLQAKHIDHHLRQFGV